MNELQAAFLRVKLKRLDEWNSRRRAVAARYLSELHDAAELKLPFVPDWAEPAWHHFAVRRENRDEFQDSLARAGVGTLIHYPIPPHLSGAYLNAGWKRGDFRVAEKVSDTELSLPIGPHLRLETQEAIIRAVHEFVDRSRSMQLAAS